MITAISGVIASSISSIPPFDPDAQAFFNAETAAGVTLTTTQKDAVNQWVVDAKAAGIWTKFKAVYPMIGGTATAHKFNLINPADTNAAFRLQFFGGGTHSANGYLPNGSNAYANTFCATNNMGLNSIHLSYYSRTNLGSNGTAQIGSVYTSAAPNSTSQMLIKDAYIRLNQTGTITSVTNTITLGLHIATRTASNLLKLNKNGSTIGTWTNASAATSTIPLYIAANNQNNTTINSYTSAECAFASIGDGLTDLESQLFYQITEKYQVALGRNVNATQSFYYNSAYNNETNAFLFSTQITDNTIQTATNTLVNDLKTANIWTKMKAVYPMVGGTATTHKFNLVNAQDTDAAFRLSFVGGVTHSANGIQGNGINGYANTFLTPSTSLSLNSTHISTYVLNNIDGTKAVIGTSTSTNTNDCLIMPRTANFFRGTVYVNGTNPLGNADSRGFFLAYRNNSTNQTLQKNNTQTLFNTTSTARSNVPFYLGANNAGTSGIIRYSDHIISFTSIGDGLTNSEALSLYNAVQTFQTTLGRNV